MYGITTIHKLNAANREAEEIIKKHEREDAIRASIREFEAKQARECQQAFELSKA
jgi:hypothetical protein